MFKVLLASITYYKGDENDEVVILVPKDADSVWAAVENIIKKSILTKNDTGKGSKSKKKSSKEDPSPVD